MKLLSATLLFTLCVSVVHADDRLLQLIDKVWRIGPQGQVRPFSYSFPNGSLGMSGFGSTQPLPSPDGRWIVFGRDSNLYLLSVASGQEHKITEYGRPYTQRYASVEVLATAWSFDSSRLLFSVVNGETDCADCDRDDFVIRPAPYGFYSLDLRTESIQHLCLPEGFEFAAWLADGGLLGFVTLPETKPCQEILQIFLPGEKQGMPVGAPVGSLDQIDVTADGKWAVGYWDGGCDRPEAGQLIKIDLQEKSATPITPVFLWAENQWPKLSPNAMHIAYVHTDRMVQGNLEESLILDGSRLSSCNGSIQYEWVNERMIAMACQDKVVILDVLTRQPVAQSGVLP